MVIFLGCSSQGMPSGSLPASLGRYPLGQRRQPCSCAPACRSGNCVRTAVRGVTRPSCQGVHWLGELSLRYRSIDPFVAPSITPGAAALLQRVLSFCPVFFHLHRRCASPCLFSLLGDCSDLLTGLDAPVLDISPGFQDTLVAHTVKNLLAMQETRV